MDGRDGPFIKSGEEMVGRFQAELISLLPDWKRKLDDAPSQFEELEKEVHAEFSRGADMLVVGLMSARLQRKDWKAVAEATRRSHRYPLERGRERQVRVRLLGGLLIWVTSLYCAPRRSRRQGTEESRPGLYVSLASFGFGKGVSPGLQSRLARQSALCPSFQFAQQELERTGVKLDVKTVRRVTHQCGQGLLRLRREELLKWRDGQLPAGTEFAGCRVSVQIDGGRTKIRGGLRERNASATAVNEDGLPVEDAPGRSRKRPRRTYDSDWREPKLVTLFVHNDQGRMIKQSRATIDGTFLGPDATAELVAMHLHRLGAAQAKSVTFVADGAPWIWDRIGRIVELAQLQHVKTHEVLDCCHASHHVSLALAALGLADDERMPAYRTYRTMLRNGQWRQVVDELSELASDHPGQQKVETEINYLRKHGDSGRMSYPSFRRAGLPLGSGAIESSIRRVINLRLKNNGTFWREENAESMLQVRAQVITDRWDERLQAARLQLKSDARTDWRWSPQDMRFQSERSVGRVN